MSSLEGRVAFITGASGGIGAAVARMLTTPGRQSAWRPGAATISASSARSGNRATCATRRRSTRSSPRRSSGSAGSTSSSRTRASAPTGRSSSSSPRAPRGDDRHEPEGDAVRGPRQRCLICCESDAADVVTLASEAGRRGLPFEAVYCASKFGQVGFTRALDHELREQGVRCTNVCPGGVATDFALEAGRGRTPDALPGMMTAEDVAEVVVFVLTRPRNHRILETAFRPMTETAGARPSGGFPSSAGTRAAARCARRRPTWSSANSTHARWYWWRLSSSSIDASRVLVGPRFSRTAASSPRALSTRRRRRSLLWIGKLEGVAEEPFDVILAGPSRAGCRRPRAAAAGTAPLNRNISPMPPSGVHVSEPEPTARA